MRKMELLVQRILEADLRGTILRALNHNNFGEGSEQAAWQEIVWIARQMLRIQIFGRKMEEE